METDYFDEILPSGEDQAPIEAWTPDDFDHFTDVGLLRSMAEAEYRLE